jgi:hypothetical protein
VPQDNPDVCVPAEEFVPVAAPAELPPVQPQQPAAALVQHFDPGPAWGVFWTTYTEHPHGVCDGEAAAQAWWYRTVKTASYAAEIIEGLNEHIAGDRWSRGIGIPNAIRFLSEHWYRRKVRPRLPPQSERKGDNLRAWARQMQSRGVA